MLSNKQANKYYHYLQKNNSGSDGRSSCRGMNIEIIIKMTIINIIIITATSLLSSSSSQLLSLLLLLLMLLLLLPVAVAETEECDSSSSCSSSSSRSSDNNSSSSSSISKLPISPDPDLAWQLVSLPPQSDWHCSPSQWLASHSSDVTPDLDRDLSFHLLPAVKFIRGYGIS